MLLKSGLKLPEEDESDEEKKKKKDKKRKGESSSSSSPRKKINKGEVVKKAREVETNIQSVSTKITR